MSGFKFLRRYVRGVFCIIVTIAIKKKSAIDYNINGTLLYYNILQHILHLAVTKV